MSARTQPAWVTGPCLCDGRYFGCEHGTRCGQPNDGTKRGPWCAECNPRRLAHISTSLENLAADFRGGAS